MELEYEETLYKKLRLNDEQMKKVTIAYLCKIYNWDEFYYIKDGKVLEDVEYHTSHSFDITEERRKATKEDKIIYDIIKKLKGL